MVGFFSFLTRIATFISVVFSNLRYVYCVYIYDIHMENSQKKKVGNVLGCWPACQKISFGRTDSCFFPKNNIFEENGDP